MSTWIYDTIAGISEGLQMPILDWENARSRRDYNCYESAIEAVRVVAESGMFE